MEGLDREDASVGKPPTGPAQGQGHPGIRLAVFLVVVAGVVALAAYNIVELIRQSRIDAQFRPQRSVSLGEQPPDPGGGPTEDADRQSSLRIAIAPVISPEKSLRIYRDFVDYLAGELGREPVFLQGETYLKVNDLVRYGRCDVALVCTSAFVRGEQEFGMKVLAVPLIGGVETYHSYIVVPQSSRATSLLDLRGKRFASADILSNSGWLYPATWLSDHGENAASFFGNNHVITGSHDRSVVAVVSGYVDGAAVDSLVYDQMVDEDPSVGEKTKIILKSPPFGMPPVVTHPGIDTTLGKELLAAMLGMHESEEGKKILAALRIDRFVVPEDKLFDSVREASKAWESPR